MNEISLRWVSEDTWTYEATVPSAATTALRAAPAATSASSSSGGGGESGTEAPHDGEGRPLGCLLGQDHEELLLLFLGLDTVADVFIAGRLLLQARNFHR